METKRNHLNLVQDGWDQGNAAPGHKPIAFGGGGSDITDMQALKERLAKLEGAFDWVKTTLTVVAAVVIFGIGFVTLQNSRLETKVEALPSAISVSIRETNRSFIEALEAARTQPPQVVILPASAVTQPQEAKPVAVPK